MENEEEVKIEGEMPAAPIAEENIMIADEEPTEEEVVAPEASTEEVSA